MQADTERTLSDPTTGTPPPEPADVPAASPDDPHGIDNPASQAGGSDAELLRQTLENEAARAYVDRIVRLMEEEVEARCGRRGERSPNRTATREGHDVKADPVPRPDRVEVRVQRMRELLPGTGTARGRSFYPQTCTTPGWHERT